MKIIEVDILKNNKNNKISYLLTRNPGETLFCICNEFS